MNGTVKWFDNNKGFGYIIVPGSDDYFFHISQVQTPGARPPRSGDGVTFEPSIGKKGKLAAVNIVVVSKSPNQSGRPYYGRATYRTEIVQPAKPGMTRVGAAWGLGFIGMIVGSFLAGWIGAAIGCVIGVVLGYTGEDIEGKPAVTKQVEITSPCIRCGGKGQVTARIEGRTGFQCRTCGSSWTQGENVCIRCSKKGRVVSRIDGETEWECESCGISWWQQ